MGKVYTTITDELAQFIEQQKMFFVATAPLANDGLVNVSPKGLDTLRILDDRTVAYLDLTGSGAETVAHLRENGRMTLMFCAFEGAPNIVRLQGVGDAIEPSDPDWDSLRPLFPDLRSARAIIRLKADRISDSCGFAVPTFEFTGDRDMLLRSWNKATDEHITDYQVKNNSVSIDGLPALKRHSN